jgi:glutamine synthetase
VGSACHSHISVHKEAASRKSDLPESLNDAEASFLSGVLEHLPAICAVTLPITASYARMVDGAWTGGTYVSWSRDHRETPIRLCGSPEAGAGHFEFRPLDGTANPYIALAAILAAGNVGIRDQSTLSMQACVKEAPAEMSEEKRRGMGITRRLPLSLAEARSSFERDDVLKKALGRVGDTWVDVNQV